jgi:PASTA domain
MSVITAAPAPSPSATPTPSAIAPDLSSTGLVWLIVIGLLLVAIFVLINTALSARLNRGRGNIPLPSVVRAWIAIALVVGLLVFTGATLGGQDESLRSSLVGALVAAVGSATAYYFATKSAETAINAVTGAAAVANDVVPTLTGLSLGDALAALGSTNFKLVVDAASVAAAATPAVVLAQTTPAGSSVAGNSEIVVQLAPAVAAAPPAAAPAAAAPDVPTP